MAKKKGKTTIKCESGRCCVIDKRSGETVRCWTPKKRRKGK